MSGHPKRMRRSTAIFSPIQKRSGVKPRSLFSLRFRTNVREALAWLVRTVKVATMEPERILRRIGTLGRAERTAVKKVAAGWMG